MLSSTDLAFKNSDFNGLPMFSASSAAYSPPPKPLAAQQFSPTYSSTAKLFVPPSNITRQNSGDKLWLPSSQLAYPQQFNTQQQQYHATSNNFQYSSRRGRSNSSNLDPDSIMKVHDDLPSAAILAWERFKARNQRLKRN